MNGQGKSSRKGITLNELLQTFPNDATAEKWFADAEKADLRTFKS